MIARLKTCFSNCAAHVRVLHLYYYCTDVNIEENGKGTFVASRGGKWFCKLGLKVVRSSPTLK